MTEEELSDVVFQKSLITRVWAILSPHEPAKAVLGPTVVNCKTLEEFFTAWMEFKIAKEQEIKKLTFQGYSIIPKIFMLAAGYNKEEKNTKDANSAAGGIPGSKGNKTKVASATNPNGNKVSRNTLTILDAAIPACYICGRQEIDKV